ncbi:cilia- and flagella-associated protein 206-like isoform X1 [Limulus polyphemus]|uniref:Cilia- and flagella-associated protein 206 n=2 Tax=Limulus polyphemus TaxID=6850 RepID=A0ABM1SZV4_LIMPO|nr:cilia- and flagella-associated protein 206-like isoform X1 [Limulus polyphemus]XP_022249159.1 cilia- and flagella-associated protein 206-like isoform X1 [Limulus polyphemus]XP_022249160.1 cilia- and flagella-associated protein 206-like isoform X1 [Limulus polyphemus]
MTNEAAASVIKNIINEIVQECSLGGKDVSDSLAAFILKVVTLSQGSKYVDRALSREDVMNLVQDCVKWILNPQQLSMDTIKMQIYMDVNYITRNDFIQKHQSTVCSRLQSIQQEITDARARTKQQLELLYSTIVSYLLMKTGLGNPSETGAVRETTAALQNVFPQTELGAFMALDKESKIQKLSELAMIVTGIRLYHRDRGSEGIGIDNVDTTLQDNAKKLVDKLETQLKKTKDLISKLISVLQNSGIMPAKTYNHYDETLTTQNTELMGVLANLRQYELFLLNLLSDASRCRQKGQDLQFQFKTIITQLQKVTQTRRAVSTVRMFPLFISLAKNWSLIQEELTLLSMYSTIENELQSFTQHSKSLLCEVFEGLEVELSAVEPEEIDKKEIRIHKVSLCHSSVDVIYPETVLNFELLPLQFSGFCPWTLVKSKGILLHGKRQLGIVLYQGYCYNFYTSEAGQEFIEEPEKYLSEIRELALQRPELILLLELKREFDLPLQKNSSHPNKPVIKIDSAVQTDTHPLTSNIDLNYQWNQWELRREALKMADMKKKYTHSTQTDLSHFRRENFSQVYLPKKNWSQTKQDRGISIPKIYNHLSRVRGDSSGTCLKVVNITLDL